MGINMTFYSVHNVAICAVVSAVLSRMRYHSLIHTVVLYFVLTLPHVVIFGRELTMRVAKTNHYLRVLRSSCSLQVTR